MAAVFTCVCATAGLCSVAYYGHAKLRKNPRNLWNICHTAKTLDGRDEGRGGSFSCGENTEHMPPIPASTSLLSPVQIYIDILARDERAQRCHSCPVLRKALNAPPPSPPRLPPRPHPHTPPHEWWLYVQTCSAARTLRPLMSCFGQACHGPGGVLSRQGVMFKTALTHTQNDRMQLRAPVVDTGTSVPPLTQGQSSGYLLINTLFNWFEPKLIYLWCEQKFFGTFVKYRSTCFPIILH